MARTGVGDEPLQLGFQLGLAKPQYNPCISAGVQRGSRGFGAKRVRCTKRGAGIGGCDTIIGTRLFHCGRVQSRPTPSTLAPTHDLRRGCVEGDQLNQFRSRVTLSCQTAQVHEHATRCRPARHRGRAAGSDEGGRNDRRPWTPTDDSILSLTKTPMSW